MVAVIIIWRLAEIVVAIQGGTSITVCGVAGLLGQCWLASPTLLILAAPSKS